MKEDVLIKEVSFEEANKVNKEIPEFMPDYVETRFKENCSGRETLIFVAYVNEKPAGYNISYDKFGDESFYCWCAGVKPEFRRKGVLKKMMEYQEAWAKKRGYNKISSRPITSSSQCCLSW